LLVASCSSSAGSSDKTESGTKNITIMLGGLAMTQAPFYVAQKEGFFAENGLNANITISPNGVATAISAAVSGSALLSVFGAAGAIPAIAKGAPMKMVGVTVLGYDSAVVVNTAYAKTHNLSPSSSLLDRVKSMQGATIGVYTAGGSDEQIPLGSTKFVPLGDQAGLLAGLDRGDVDFTAASSPLDAHAVEGGKGERYIPYTDLTPLAHYPYSVAIAGNNAISTQSSEIRGALAAFSEACAFMKSSPNQAKSDLKSTFSGLSTTDFNAEFETEVGALPDSTVLSGEDYDELQSFYKTSSGSTLTLGLQQIFASEFATGN
jgi:NitT/TauT family transport system substrate-binding protein